MRRDRALPAHKDPRGPKDPPAPLVGPQVLRVNWGPQVPLVVPSAQPAQQGLRDSLDLQAKSAQQGLQGNRLPVPKDPQDKSVQPVPQVLSAPQGLQGNRLPVLRDRLARSVRPDRQDPRAAL